MTLDLFGRPALLFLPASNPRAIAKARDSDADLIVLDLQDAVKAEDKDRAREAAVEAASGDWPMPLLIRINEAHSAAHAADLAAMLHLPGQGVVMPLVRSADDLHKVTMVLGHAPLAMIETAESVLEVRNIARQALALIVGTNDLAADLHLPEGAGRGPLSFALQSTLLAARAAGLPVFDGVFNRLDDATGFAAEAAESRALGFDGKSLIHPDQIAACRTAFAPTKAEIARAERLVAAASGGAGRFEGAMVEQMHVDAARRLLARR